MRPGPRESQMSDDESGGAGNPSGGATTRRGSTPADRDRGSHLPGTLRLRSAGVGVTLAGVALPVLSVLLPFPLASGLLVGASGLAAVLVRGETVLVQLCLGTGSLGALGLAETFTGFGAGLGPLELGIVGVLFGVVDVFVGGAMHRIAGGRR